MQKKKKRAGSDMKLFSVPIKSSPDYMKTRRDTRAMAKKRQQPKEAASRKQPVKVTKPLTKDMVVAAITALKDSNGSSAQSIKNYIQTIYGDVSKSSSLGLILKAASREGKIELVVAKGGLLNYKLAQKSKSKKTLRARRAPKKEPKATSGKTAPAKKPVKDAKRPDRKIAKKDITKVSKGFTTLKATESKKASTKKTVPKKKGARKPSKTATRKREAKNASSDNEKK